MKKIVIVLEGADLVELDRILLDDDKDAALELLKKHGEKKLYELDHAHCRPIFEFKNRKEPDLLQELNNKSNS